MARTNQGPKTSEGQRRLADLLETSTLDDFREALKAHGCLVSGVTVHSWRWADNAPRDEHKAAIERATKGAIRFEDWMPDADRLRPTGT